MSLIFSPCLNDLPEKRTMSELFAGFSRHVGVTLLRHDAAFRLKNSGPRSLSFTRLISAKNL